MELVKSETPHRDWARLNQQRIEKATEACAKVLPARVHAAATTDFDAKSACYQDAAARPSGIMVLSGGIGCGKTVAAARLLFNFIADKDQWLAVGDEAVRKKTASCCFVTAAKLTRLSRFDEEKMEPIVGCDFLVIDDLGAEYQDTKGAFEAFLDEVLNERHANELRTVITTNLNVDAFRERYGSRIADRIREDGAFIATTAKSRRST